MLAFILMAASTLPNAAPPAKDPEPSVKAREGSATSWAAPAATRETNITGSGLLSAGDLQKRCNSNSDITYCYAYIAGVYDTIKSYETWLKLREFCPPFRVTQSDLQHAVVSFMARHPETASGEAASVVTVALKTQFACDTAP